MGLRVRDVDVQRLSDLVSVASESSLLSEDEAERVFDLVFQDALEDPYGPAGRRWALRSLLGLSVALLAREATVRAARDEVDAMEALRAALHEILHGEG
ncbi:hypothetical protein NS330_12975 [Curtobacterium citreum]|nr:hypothetical protein NS330_12975 [Curtobacterium citreum]